MTGDGLCQDFLPYNVFFKIILLVFRFCQLPMHMNEVYHRPELIKLSFDISLRFSGNHDIVTPRE